jgi:phosphonate transport system ATP-binding protein
MIDLGDVEKRFPDGTAALARVSLVVPRGQFCVVLGSSGAGKTTLLRLVNGLVRPTAGRVAVGGVPMTERTLPQIRRRVAMIHQQHELVSRLSVLTNVLAGTLAAVSTPRALLGLFPAAHRRQACRLLADVGLEETSTGAPTKLSGGQQQRVSIARAVILEPHVVLATSRWRTST